MNWMQQLSIAIRFYVAWQLTRYRMSAWSLRDKVHLRGLPYLDETIGWERAVLISRNGTDTFVLDGSVGNWCK